ncbi:uncharacterized protein LAESUDRAFT_731711 [Laetiporus sulphureus 93-53]|uniref:Uncharacterized protein n=1 Tax=Laetiporus sulphureus 93-53 TaxID=1314785 RepID=A0A165BG48_9APHY|nr:uncharacterized protein LAESUDRAFT_731711 [Laetiporus sulphureus 93-53]KZT00988.1 hypothetical protein LAESUDRAFT_731711 [Laetiporus sulphureus 93-53]
MASFPSATSIFNISAQTVSSSQRTKPHHVIINSCYLLSKFHWDTTCTICHRAMNLQLERDHVLDLLKENRPVVLRFPMAMEKDGDFWRQLVADDGRLRYLILTLSGRDLDVSSCIDRATQWTYHILKYLGTSQLICVRIQIGFTADVILQALEGLPRRFARAIPSLRYMAMEWLTHKLGAPPRADHDHPCEDCIQQSSWWRLEDTDMPRVLIPVSATVGEHVDAHLQSAEFASTLD